jgi:STE24 endopeptidase
VSIALILGYFGTLSDFIAQHISNNVLQSLLFFGVLWFFSQIVSIPFDYYDGFVIEERYGFNKSTRMLFFTDLIKSALITIILGGLILSLIVWLFISYTNLFWLPVLIFILILSLFSTVLYTSIILPLFNKKSPLPEGELKERLRDLHSMQVFLQRIFMYSIVQNDLQKAMLFLLDGDETSVFTFTIL